MAKIAHISDTHIRNLRYHKEYREVFEALYERLREEKVDYIIHCGDIAHSKTHISPEFVKLCSEFLKMIIKYFLPKKVINFSKNVAVIFQKRPKKG